MYPKKVLQGIPNRKRAFEISIFNLLVISQRYIHFVRHSLLRQARILAGFFQFKPHSDLSLR